MKTKHIIIVTGLSGAGKTTALNILEDMNYYTIDNLPLGLEKSLLDTEIEKLAVGIDIRTFKNTKDFFKFINFIKESGVKMDIIFIEAHEAIILGRYTLSRRAHPLKENTLLKSILKEKEIFAEVLYGGSVNSSNISVLKTTMVDGFLLGASGTDSQELIKIIEIINK